MSEFVTYSEIPKAERKRLATIAFREFPELRIIQTGAMFLATIVGLEATNGLLGTKASLKHFGVSILFVLILFGILWEIFLRRRLKRKIETLLNG